MTRRLFTMAAAAFSTVALLATGAAPASAATAAGFTGTATLPSFPGAGTGNFAGDAVTSSNGLVGLTATYNYSEPTTTPPCPASGTATGTFTATATPATIGTLPGPIGFSWNRTGLVAVISTSTGGTVVAVFVPLAGPGNLCGGNGGPLTAAVVGAGTL